MDDVQWGSGDRPTPTASGSPAVPEAQVPKAAPKCRSDEASGPEVSGSWAVPEGPRARGRAEVT